MSQNTCERSGVRKYKLRVQYFDHITQKNMVMDSMERLGTKNSVILKYFSPMTLWCFRKHFQNWRWNFLVASCYLNIRLRSYLSLSLNSQRFTSGNLLSRFFGQCFRGSRRGREEVRQSEMERHQSPESQAVDFYEERSGLQTLLHGTS